MDFAKAQNSILLGMHRILDSIEAQPRSLDEFNEVRARALETARATIRGGPARDSGVSADWFQAAARLGRMLGMAGPKDPDGLRLAAELLNIPRLCGRSACRRSQRCRAVPRACLGRFAPRVPEAARNSIAALAERIERGDTLELAVVLMPFENKMALWAWCRALAGGRGSEIGAGNLAACSN